MRENRGPTVQKKARGVVRGVRRPGLARAVVAVEGGRESGDRRARLRSRRVRRRRIARSVDLACAASGPGSGRGQRQMSRGVTRKVRNT